MANNTLYPVCTLSPTPHTHNYSSSLCKMSSINDTCAAKPKTHRTASVDSCTPLVTCPIIATFNTHAAHAMLFTAARDIYQQHKIPDAETLKNVRSMDRLTKTSIPPTISVPVLASLHIDAKELSASKTALPVCRAWRKTGCCRWGSGCQLAHYIGSNDTGCSIGVTVLQVM